MSEWDDLFRQETPPVKAASQNQSFDKDAWVQKKQELRQWTYETIDATSVAVAQTSEQFQQYLDVQSRFGRYSVSNALLIMAQRPEATRIADFEGWQAMGFRIRRKETGFYILEPGEEYKREDGSTAVSYNPKKMFDVAQVIGEKPELAPSPDERTRIKALTHRAPVPIQMGDALPEGMNALYQPDVRQIVIRRGLSAGDIFRSLAQELAHAELDQGKSDYSRSDHHFQASSVAYMLSKKFGMETADFRFNRAVERLKGLEPQQIRTELSVIRDTAYTMTSRMYHLLGQLRQQQPSRTNTAR
ncbi:hypothetical protein SK3146_05722 [Paenibacillus konkukensis]|uniref:DUF1738 domain-containing protein n=1 Tax=Paenibacillus konkukensis TaxID=2020716 RepID=A0ABY4RYF5_9BACL|nr:hypothetical protein [Paenibacillus konkukensis]UQZ86429.1 hypothetical protein SK3146_05722 [Paenibacillus konkukensis]